MNVGELITKLEEYGDHVDVVVRVETLKGEWVTDEFDFDDSMASGSLEITVSLT